MTYEDKFKEYLGNPREGMKAYVIELPEGSRNPFKPLSRSLDGKGRMVFKDGVVYLEAKNCSNKDAQELDL